MVQYIGSIDTEVNVIRNNEFEVDNIGKWQPSHIVISPGPGRPEDAGHSIDVIKKYGNHIPILGVCLGHQAIAVAYGGSVIHSSEIVHGKTSKIQHNGSAIFGGMNGSFTATRYHSLVAERKTLPSELKITAELENGLIMGIEHESHPVIGVQFHPESIATENGMHIIHNFLKMKP